METKVKKGYGKGWALILYAFLAYFTATAVGSAMNAASGTLSELRGWNAAMLTSFISLGAVANVVAGFIFGKLSTKASVKKLSIVCGIIWIAGVIGMGVTTNLWVFAVCLIVANGISCALGYQLAPVMIARWFPKRKGINTESIWTTKKLLSTPQVWIHGITLGFQLLFSSGLMVQLFPRLLEIFSHSYALSSNGIHWISHS